MEIFVTFVILYFVISPWQMLFFCFYLTKKLPFLSMFQCSAIIRKNYSEIHLRILDFCPDNFPVIHFFFQILWHLWNFLCQLLWEFLRHFWIFFCFWCFCKQIIFFYFLSNFFGWFLEIILARSSIILLGFPLSRFVVITLKSPTFTCLCCLQLLLCEYFWKSLW